MWGMLYNGSVAKRLFLSSSGTRGSVTFVFLGLIDSRIPEDAEDDILGHFATVSQCVGENLSFDELTGSSLLARGGLLCEEV